jgi:hypothetical protein
MNSYLECSLIENLEHSDFLSEYEESTNSSALV